MAFTVPYGTDILSRILSRVDRREQLEATNTALERATRETVEEFERMARRLEQAVARERQAERELDFERQAHQVTTTALEADELQLRRLNDENRELRRRIKAAVVGLRRLAVREGNTSAVAECDLTLDALEAEAKAQ